MAKKTKIPPQLKFGPLPVDRINKTTGLELEPGEAVMSGNAQKHAARRHPKDYAKTQPHVAQVIASPLYIGDDARNPGKIELVGRIPALGTGLLVAVEITPDGDGNYNITSFYPVSEKKISDRRQKNHLLPLK